MRGEFFIYNDQFIPVENFNDQKEDGIVVYEVLRVINGYPLFFEDHYKRLINSCELIKQNVDIEVGILFQKITDLASKNNIEVGNVMLKFVFGRYEHNEILYFIPHSYPSEEDYTKGVKTGLLYAERINPEAKVEQGIKKLANKKLENSDLYEVFLVDNDGFITEGSRSNMFFVKDEKLYTTPLNRVLKGITLIKVLEIAKHYKIEVVFERIPVSDLKDYDAAFITGTSPKILPVNKIENIEYDPENKLIKRLIKYYEKMIAQDIEKYSDM
jgi:branched-chain amino acid aminotransferase